jgi:hypothetical protein
MIRPLVLAAFSLVALPGMAQAQSQDAAQGQAQPIGEAGRAPDRVRSVTLTSPEQRCPESTAEEVVVCAVINPDEQYRVPKELRQSQEVAAQNRSWVTRTETMDDVSRVAGGLPNTCSPVGAGGFTGCNLALQRQFARERKAAERNDALVPGGEE